MPPSILVISYLFLGGAGAGALFVLLALDLLSPQASYSPCLAYGSARMLFSPARLSAGPGPHPASRSLQVSPTIRSPRVYNIYSPQPAYRPLFTPGFQAAAAALLLSALCLTFDLGRFDRLLNLFTHPTVSYITVGTYALSLAILSSLMLAVLWSVPAFRPPRWAVRSLEWLALLSTAAVMLYAGLLFQSIGTGILLGTVLIPVLFVLSALSCGLALLFLAAGLTGASAAFATTLNRLAALDALLILAELAVLAALIFGALDKPGPSQAVVALLSGSFAPAFWAVAVICGLILPFIFERVQKPPQLQTALMVLVGGFALRWCLLTAGMPVFATGYG